MCVCVCVSVEYVDVNTSFCLGRIEVISAHYQGPFIVLLGIIHQFVSSRGGRIIAGQRELPIGDRNRN